MITEVCHWQIVGAAQSNRTSFVRSAAGVGQRFELKFWLYVVAIFVCGCESEDIGTAGDRALVVARLEMEQRCLPGLQAMGRIYPAI